VSAGSVESSHDPAGPLARSMKHRARARAFCSPAVLRADSALGPIQKIRPPLFIVPPAGM
jgi:hypothetical protein